MNEYQCNVLELMLFISHFMRSFNFSKCMPNRIAIEWLAVNCEKYPEYSSYFSLCYYLALAICTAKCLKSISPLIIDVNIADYYHSAISIFFGLVTKIKVETNAHCTITSLSSNHIEQFGKNWVIFNRFMIKILQLIIERISKFAGK